MGINPVDWVLTKNNSFDPKWPEIHFLSRSAWLDQYWPGRLGFDKKWRFWPKRFENSFFTLVDMDWPVLIRWARFWLKMTVLTETTWKLIFYTGRHGLTRIDPMGSVLTKNDGFDRNGLKTHFLHWSTWFDPYGPGGLDFDQNDGFYPKRLENSFFTLVDMVWTVLTRWNRFLWKDTVDSRKIYFWILNFFLIFFGFLWIIIEIKQHSRKSWWIQN